MTIHDLDLPEEQSQIKINFPTGDSILIDTVELQILLRDSLSEFKESSDNSDIRFLDIFRTGFKKAYNRDITRSWANIIIDQLNSVAIPELKKTSSPSEDFVDITDSVFPSPEDESNSSDLSNRSSGRKKSYTPDHSNQS